MVKARRMVPYGYPAYGIPAVCRMPFTKLTEGFRQHHPSSICDLIIGNIDTSIFG